MTTTLLANDATGIANGTAVTQGSSGNSGGTSGDYWDLISLNSGSIVADNTYTVGSVMSYKFTQSAGVVIAAWSRFAAQSDFSVQVYTRWNANPSGGCVFAKGYSDDAMTVPAWSVAVTSAGKLQILNSASASAYTSTASIPTSKFIRWEIEAISATSIRVAAYDTVTGLLIVDSGVITNSGAGSTEAIRLGILTASSGITSLWMSRPRIGNGGGFFGRPSANIYPYKEITSGAFVAAGGATSRLAVLQGGTGEIDTPSNPSGAVYEVGYQDIDAGTFTITFDPTAPSGTISTVLAEVYCGATQIATMTVSGVNSATPQQTLSVDSGHAAAITDWSNLSFRMTWTQ